MNPLIDLDTPRKISPVQIEGMVLGCSAHLHDRCPNSLTIYRTSELLSKREKPMGEDPPGITRMSNSTSLDRAYAMEISEGCFDDCTDRNDVGRADSGGSKAMSGDM